MTVSSLKFDFRLTVSPIFTLNYFFDNYRSVEDVKEWVKQIGFPQYADSFSESRVDGDLLLQVHKK